MVLFSLRQILSSDQLKVINAGYIITTPNVVTQNYNQDSHLVVPIIIMPTKLFNVMVSNQSKIIHDKCFIDVHTYCEFIVKLVSITVNVHLTSTTTYKGK